jgi:hypothetical protein
MVAGMLLGESVGYIGGGSESGEPDDFFHGCLGIPSCGRWKERHTSKVCCCSECEVVRGCVL